MEEQRRSRRNFLQNITITLLSILAVVLLARSQLSSLELPAAYDEAAGTANQIISASPAAGLTAPVRVAVTGADGRYGSGTMLTGSDVFTEPLGRCLLEALGSARDYAVCGNGDFLRALEGTSLYYDFLEPLPLSVLAGLVGASLDSGMSVRRVVISAMESGSAALYLWCEGDVCQRGTSAVSAEELDQVVSGYEFNGAYFALDSEGPDTSGLAPCSLFPLEPPSLPVLSSAAALPSSDALLSALSFYPRTNSRYTESGGVEVITDGDRTLRLNPDGSIRYRSGGDPALTIAAAGENPTVTEAVMGVSTLLNTLLAGQTSEASLYLKSVRQLENATLLSFGWQSGGVPIRFDRDGSAAEVTLSGSVVSGLTFRFRQYADTGETSLLLPLRQALAIAARQEGAELSIGYVDSGGAASAKWLAD